MTPGAPIDTLTIRGFKSIVALDELPLRPLNVLIGPNGAGKSNFVSYFRMLGELVEGRLQYWTAQQGGADRIVAFGVKQTKSMHSKVSFGRNAYSFELSPTVSGGFVFSDETAFFAGDLAPNISRPLGVGHLESQLKQRALAVTQSTVESYCYEAISSWKVFHFHDTSDSAGVKRQGALQDNAYLRSDASNLAAYLHRLQSEHKLLYRRIRDIIRLAVPLFDDFDLRPTPLPSGEQTLQLLWRQRNSDYPFSPSQLSDGSIRFICLVTALLQPYRPSTIVIDEPELGLHPYALTLLGALLRSAAAETQVIVSTQSVALLNEFSIDDLIVVESENGETVFRRHDEADFKEWLEEYSIGELWEKNVLLGRPRA